MCNKKYIIYTDESNITNLKNIIMVFCCLIVWSMLFSSTAYCMTFDEKLDVLTVFIDSRDPEYIDFLQRAKPQLIVALDKCNTWSQVWHVYSDGYTKFQVGKCLRGESLDFKHFCNYNQGYIMVESKNYPVKRIIAELKEYYEQRILP